MVAAGDAVVGSAVTLLRAGAKVVGSAVPLTGAKVVGDADTGIGVIGRRVVGKFVKIIGAWVVGEFVTITGGRVAGANDSGTAVMGAAVTRGVGRRVVGPRVVRSLEDDGAFVVGDGS
jgi:hypothetical protein